MKRVISILFVVFCFSLSATAGTLTKHNIGKDFMEATGQEKLDWGKVAKNLAKTKRTANEIVTCLTGAMDPRNYASVTLVQIYAMPLGHLTGKCISFLEEKN